MDNAAPTLTDTDILFLVETVLPQRSDKERLVGSLRGDAKFLESMLDDPALFQRLMADEELFLRVSPTLFFHALLRQARKDMRTQHYTMEVREGQRLPIFDSHQVDDLLADPPLLDYLAQMLASFTRVESFSYSVRVRRGQWRRHHVSELDVDSLIGLSQAVEEGQRFGIYRRIGDLCLFLPGIFPEHVAAEETRSRSNLRYRRGLEDYEFIGRESYRLAAQHQTAHFLRVQGVLSTLAEQFALIEKPLQFVSEHYLSLRKHALFGL